MMLRLYFVVLLSFASVSILQSVFYGVLHCGKAFFTGWPRTPFPCFTECCFPSSYILFPCSVNQFFLVLLQTLHPALHTSAFLHSYKLCFLLIKVNLLCLIFIVCNFSACALSMSQIAYSVRYQLIGGVPCLSRCELFTCEHRLWYFCIFW